MPTVEEMVLKVKKVTPDARLPEKTHTSDLGWDLFCAETVVIPNGQRRLVRTGVIVSFPPFIGGILKDRSGVAFKQGLFVKAGVIDPDYRGEIKVLMYNSETQSIEIAEGAKIAQMVIMPSFRISVIETDDLDETERGAKGFGSTDQ